MKYHSIDLPVDILETRSAKDNTVTAKFTGYGGIYYNGTPQTECVLCESPRYVERIVEGAFDEVLSLNKPVQLRFEHRADSVLDDNVEGTLKLSTDSKGLYFESESAGVADDIHCRTAASKVKRRIAKGSSIGFNDKGLVTKQTVEGNTRVFWLHKIPLEEISIVTEPAYPAATTHLRSRKELDAEFERLETQNKTNEILADFKKMKSEA